jgi:hypothetical protein
MAIDFPNSPTTNDTYTVGSRTWTWTGTNWELKTGAFGAGTVGTTELADNAVTTAKIAAGAVVEADIASNAVTAGKLGADVQLGYRNVLINGAMQVHQRGTSTAGITTGGYYTADRYNLYINSLGTWTQSVENDAPTGSGFRKSLKMLCTTADASPSANDYIMVEQSIEGQNVQQFLKGTSSAKPFALSFWVKSNVTGTYIAELFDSDTAGARLVSASYTISASATWEKKTIIFPADTTGLFDNDTAASLTVEFWLGSGSAYASGTLNNAWAAANSSNRAVGQTNLASATSNYWQVTGVQLEAGSVATPFEFEQISDTLTKCQRYYYRTTTAVTQSRFGPTGAFVNPTQGLMTVQHPTLMRAAASSIEGNLLAVYDYGLEYAVTSLTFAASWVTPQAMLLSANIASGGTQYRPCHLTAATSTAAYFAVSAEL